MHKEQTTSEFTEMQQFRAWWVYAFIGIVTIVMIAALYSAVFDASSTTTDSLVLLILGMYLPTAIMIGVLLLFWFMRLETRIDSKGIHYKYFPFHQKFKTIEWSQLREAYVRSYSPLMEFGGWGYRLSIFGNGKALSVSGTMGIQLVTSTGSKLLLGTQKVPEAESVLQNISPLTREKHE